MLRFVIGVVGLVMLANVIPRDDVVGVELRVDMVGVADEVLSFFHEAQGSGRAGRAQELHQARMDAATKYRAWLTTSDAHEYRSVRFDDVRRFNALQRALQFAF